MKTRREGSKREVRRELADWLVGWLSSSRVNSNENISVRLHLGILMLSD